MSVRTKISVRMNALTKEKVANGNIYFSLQAAMWVK